MAATTGAVALLQLKERVVRRLRTRCKRLIPAVGNEVQRCKHNLSDQRFAQRRADDAVDAHEAAAEADGDRAGYRPFFLALIGIGHDHRAPDVEPVAAADESRYQRLMQAHHYLDALPRIGETQWYVARWRREWVALIGFSAPALKCRARDAWNGWDFRVQYDRLHPVTDNSRFLILPGWHRPSLLADLDVHFRKRGEPDFRERAQLRHGRIESRAIWTTATRNDYLTFPHVGQAFLVERTVTAKTTGKQTVETAYGITSHSPNTAIVITFGWSTRPPWKNRRHAGTLHPQTPRQTASSAPIPPDCRAQSEPAMASPVGTPRLAPSTTTSTPVPSTFARRILSVPSSVQ